MIYVEYSLNLTIIKSFCIILLYKREDNMKLKKIVVVLAALCTFSSGYSWADTVGVSWARFQEERWITDQKALEARLNELGHKLITADARGSVEQQAADIESLLARGIDALLIISQDTTAVIPAAETALNEGIPVIAYERQIKHPGVTYVGFDPVLVGRAQAKALMEVQPEGNYVLIKGGPADAYAHGTLAGQMDIISEAVNSGKINIIADEWTTDWKPEIAQSNMENIITAHGDNIDAVLCSNDGMASGVAAALEQAGLSGLPLSGQDGDIAAVNRIARGLQTMTAWKDVRQLGKYAANLTHSILSGSEITSIAGHTVFEDKDSRIKQNAFPLDPTSITADNLGLMLDAGWVTKEQMCRGVDASIIKICG